MKGLERTIGSSFRNKKLLLTALIHPSFPTEGESRHSAVNFQRFEFLGDSILNGLIAEKLYILFPEANEGLLSRLRSILVSRKLLARVARSIRLGTYLRLGEREKKLPAQIREKIMADSFEALIAAIHFDRGKKILERFLSKCFESYFDQKRLFQLDPNPKSMLQEHTQKKYRILPEYRTHHAKEKGSFAAWVTIKGRNKTKGEGKTKREAESKAAATLLRKLKIN